MRYLLLILLLAGCVGMFSGCATSTEPTTTPGQLSPVPEP
jgi:hypothetical protein